MLRFLLQRPIAVTMTLIAALAFSVLAYLQLPVSLLPPIDVPEINVSVRYPNSSPDEIEKNVLQPIRERMLTLDGLKTVESIAYTESGTVTLRFQHGIKMDLAYIEVNEKVDRLTQVLPENLPRPTVIKSGTSDIPILRIQVIPKHSQDLVSVSEFTTKTLKRRVEQVEGIGMVDVNGTQTSVIRVAPDYNQLRALKLTERDLINAIKDANIELGALAVKDGNYKYFVQLTSKIDSPKELEQLPVNLPDTAGVVLLKQVASIEYGTNRPLGFHLFGTHDGLVMTVHKQAIARMPEVMPKLYALVDEFRTTYPTLDFQVTQDQSTLLRLSIENLSQALVIGGIFAFSVLFVFMRGWREPLIMGIVLPVSLLLAFSVLYLLGITINIISLSGLALGVGMLVDNSIVVLDSIILKRNDGLNVIDSCVRGTQEVIVPLISSALTNIAVFLPLIFLSRLTGALFYDQAIAVISILSVSILCTFILVPLFYLLFFRNRIVIENQESILYLGLRKLYERSFQFVWKHKKMAFITLSLFVPIGIALLFILPKTGFPDIERTESIVLIDWNEPIDIMEVRERVRRTIDDNAMLMKVAEAEVGHQQFMLNTKKQSIQHARIYLGFNDEAEKRIGDAIIKEYLTKRFPLAKIEFAAAPNAFEQIFSTSQPYFEARFRSPQANKLISKDKADSLISSIAQNNKITTGKGFETETMVFLRIDFDKSKKYEISYSTIVEQLKIAFGQFLITDFKNFGEIVPVVLEQNVSDFETEVTDLRVRSSSGILYPLQNFITIEYKHNYKNITADATGIFQSVEMTEHVNVEDIKAHIMPVAEDQSLTVDFTGSYFDNKEALIKVILIMIVSVLLMFFILTAEFESFGQPLLVMLSIPIGFAGSLLLLWAFGGSINIMSGIGLVVVLGILDNDAILKIDRINRLRKELPLEEAIKKAGTDRLKAIVMNTCTNVLAIAPILFSAGLGADLQRPVAITTIGGLLMGTITALYFIPIAYWYLQKFLKTNETN